MDTKRLFSDLVRHEGVRLKPYRCTAGKLTIGIGRNLEDTGISTEEAMLLLKNDIERLMLDARLRVVLEGHNSVRQEALTNMAFNLGVDGLMKFRNMIAALERKDYDRAAREMLDSRWARQVGYRATELASRMKTGKVRED